jgi:hypothetical protein
VSSGRKDADIAPLAPPPRLRRKTVTHAHSRPPCTQISNLGTGLTFEGVGDLLGTQLGQVDHARSADGASIDLASQQGFPLRAMNQS